LDRTQVESQVLVRILVEAMLPRTSSLETQTPGVCTSDQHAIAALAVAEFVRTSEESRVLREFRHCRGEIEAQLADMKRQNDTLRHELSIKLSEQELSQKKAIQEALEASLLRQTGWRDAVQAIKVELQTARDRITTAEASLREDINILSGRVTNILTQLEDVRGVGTQLTSLNEDVELAKEKITALLDELESTREDVDMTTSELRRDLSAQQKSQAQDITAIQERLRSEAALMMDKTEDLLRKDSNVSPETLDFIKMLMARGDELLSLFETQQGRWPSPDFHADSCKDHTPILLVNND